MAGPEHATPAPQPFPGAGGGAAGRFVPLTFQVPRTTFLKAPSLEIPLAETLSEPPA